MLLATIPSGRYYFGDVLEIIDNQYIDFVEEYKNNIFNEIKIEDKKYYLTLIPIISDIITYHTTNEEDSINREEKIINIKNNYFGIIDENLIDKSKLNNTLQQKIEFENMFNIYYAKNTDIYESYPPNSLKIYENKFGFYTNKYNIKNIIFKFNKIENIELYNFDLISTLPSGHYIIGYIYELVYKEYFELLNNYNNCEINTNCLYDIINYNKNYIENLINKLNDNLNKLDLIDTKKNIDIKEKGIINGFIHRVPSIISMHENNVKSYELLLKMLNIKNKKIYYSYSNIDSGYNFINSLNNYKYYKYDYEPECIGIVNLDLVLQNNYKYGTIYNFNYPIFFGKKWKDNSVCFIIKSKKFYLEIESNNDESDKDDSDKDDSDN